MPRPCGSMELMLGQDTYLPGAEVCGLVSLGIDTEVEDATLMIELRAEERVIARNEGRSAARRLGHTVMAREKTLLRSVNLVPGFLDVSFLITIPLNGLYTRTVEYGALRSGAEVSLKIAYWVFCRLQVKNSPGASIVRFSPITVANVPMAQRVGEPISRSFRQDFHYGFFQRSYCQVDIQLDSDVYSGLSPIKANVVLELAMLERFRHVRLSLYRRIRPLVRGLHPFPKEDHDMVCSRLFPRSRLPAVDAFSVELPISTTLLKDPDPLKPSMKFRHFQISYDVQVQVNIKSCPLIELRIPVTIVASELPEGLSILSHDAVSLPTVVDVDVPMAIPLELEPRVHDLS